MPPYSADFHQPDLFGGGPAWPCGPAAASTALAPPLRPAEMDDAALMAAIPDAARRDCRALTEEAARRHLEIAVPALETLCRRFRGFGLEHVIPEQQACLLALAAIGGRAATQVVARLIADRVVLGPGIVTAVAAAANLGTRLPAAITLGLLQHSDPRVRADACRLAGASRQGAAVLVELLGDLHPPVTAAAACALGLCGQVVARPVLLRLLAEAPWEQVIEALAAVADDDALVRLGQLARVRADVADAVLEALEDIDTPLAKRIATSIRHSRR